MNGLEQAQRRDNAAMIAAIAPQSRRRSMLLLMVISAGSWMLIAGLLALTL
jgi:hypothetical protein